MLKYKKRLTNSPCIILEDTNKILNTLIIMNLDSQKITSEGFWTIEEERGEYIIISKRYRAYLKPNDIYYGIITTSLKTIIDPEKSDYLGQQGLERVREILNELEKLDEKYLGIPKLIKHKTMDYPYKLR